MSNGGKRPGAGRPKGTVAKSTLEAIVLKQKLIEAYSLKADKINDALIKKAIAGDVAAIKELHDRTWGKSTQGVELSGKDGKELPATPRLIEYARFIDSEANRK